MQNLTQVSDIQAERRAHDHHLPRWKYFEDRFVTLVSTQDAVQQINEAIGGYIDADGWCKVVARR